MRRVSQGDREHRAAEQGPIEISQLAKGLNGMLNAIEAAEKAKLSNVPPGSKWQKDSGKLKPWQRLDNYRPVWLMN